MQRARASYKNISAWRENNIDIGCYKSSPVKYLLLFSENWSNACTTRPLKSHFMLKKLRVFYDFGANLTTNGKYYRKYYVTTFANYVHLLKWEHNI